MTNVDTKKFALALAAAEKEKEVINILRKAGYWDTDAAWCEYGNDPMNYSTIGNQQHIADSALVEKLVNSVDAVLMLKCLKQGINPSSSNAPQTIAEAQEYFGVYNGKLSSIDGDQRADLANNILLVATGSRSRPSFSIIDKGEGQSPKRIPETILSLTKNNKTKIPFVQGKFGMGGSGVLRFCSPTNNILLVISKRNHEIDAKTDEKIYGTDKTRDLWGVTVVRREDPKDGEKNSHYTYLAPKGGILSLEEDELRLLPGPYPETLHNSLKSGTFIKLYEYDIGPRLKTLITFNLYYRLSLLMPDVALPIRLIERRKGYEAHSHATTLAGLSVRLDEDKSKNLEPEFQTPSTGEMTVEGQKLDYSIYVFKKAKKENYAKREGVVFSINGQAHGFLTKEFFDRKKVGMAYLSDSILVTIDCSETYSRVQERLFMPSRDRLASTPIRYSIERELEGIIKIHSGLRELQNRRRREAIENNLQDSKPLVDVLENIIKKSPTLAALLIRGKQISNPFNMESVASQEKFKGKEFPTYFKSVKEFTEKKPKHCPINHEFRVQYETDAKNNYFHRDKDPGKLTLEIADESIQDYSLNLWNGLATLTIRIPANAKVGETLCFRTKVSDSRLIVPFNNEFCIILEQKSTTNGSGGKRKSPPSEKRGKDRQKESYLDMPNVVDIRQKDWKDENYRDFHFNQKSALKVKLLRDGGYDFFINIDNLYLKNEIKSETQTDEKILEARYRYGMVLIGISILHFEENRQKSQGEANDNDPNGNGLSIYDQVSQLTEAVSPTLLPMIAALGSSEFEA